MKRDMDMVRDILFVIAESADGFDCTAYEDADSAEYNYRLLCQAGFVTEFMPLRGEVVTALTDKGAELLDALFDPYVYEEVKVAVENSVANAPLSVWVEVSKKVAERKILDVIGKEG